MRSRHCAPHAKAQSPASSREPPPLLSLPRIPIPPRIAPDSLPRSPHPPCHRDKLPTRFRSASLSSPRCTPGARTPAQSSPPHVEIPQSASPCTPPPDAHSAKNRTQSLLPEQSPPRNQSTRATLYTSALQPLAHSALSASVCPASTRSAPSHHSCSWPPTRRSPLPAPQLALRPAPKSAPPTTR
jgi:hypothetical protein